MTYAIIRSRIVNRGVSRMKKRLRRVRKLIKIVLSDGCFERTFIRTDAGQRTIELQPFTIGVGATEAVMESFIAKLFTAAERPDLRDFMEVEIIEDLGREYPQRHWRGRIPSTLYKIRVKVLEERITAVI